MKITNHSDIKRFSKIEFLVYEYVNLMALVNPAVGFYLKMQLSFLLCIQSTPMMIEITAVTRL